MKYLQLILLIFIISACSDKTITNNYIEVEYIEVQFFAKSLISVNEQAFLSKSTIEHEVPTDFTAYFIANETRGEYVTGDAVQTISVSTGINDIEVPKMSYNIYVTNYEESGTWYTWNDATDQLPQTSHDLYLYGKNEIDYTTSDFGEVELHNPYAAVMILNNEWLNGVPSSYDTGQEYMEMGMWYNLYTRNDNTNTKIPIEIPGNPNQSYTLNRDIEANKIYQFTINGNVLVDEGSLGITTIPMESGYEEEINL